MSNSYEDKMRKKRYVAHILWTQYYAFDLS